MDTGAAGMQQQQPDESTWDEIESNYFNSMRQHRELEDRNLEADFQHQSAALKAQLVDNYNAQHELLRKLHALKAEYEAKETALKALDREFDAVMRERQREREAEDEDRRQWFRRFRRGGLAYRVAQRDASEQEAESEAEQDRAQGQDQDQDQHQPQHHASINQGQDQDQDQDQDQELGRTEEEENDEILSRKTADEALPHTAEAPSSRQEQATPSDGDSEMRDAGAPLSELQVPDKEVSDTESPAEEQAGEDSSAASLHSKHVEDARPDESELPNGGEPASTRNEQQTLVSQHGMEVAIPQEEDRPNGIDAVGGAENMNDVMEPSADLTTLSPRPSEISTSGHPREDAAIDDLTPAETTHTEPPVEHAAELADMDVEMGDVQEQSEKVVDIIAGKHPSEPAQMVVAAPSPSSSSELSSRHTTPTLDTPELMAVAPSQPPSPVNIASAGVEVLSASGELIGTIQPPDIDNYYMSRLTIRPIKRQLELRPTKKFSAEDLDAVPRPETSDARAFKFISLYVQATGEEQARPCADCALNHGPFQGCVMVDDAEFNRCGNCEWNKRRCHGASLEAPSTSRKPLPSKGNTTGKSQTNQAKPRVSSGGFTAVNSKTAKQTGKAKEEDSDDEEAKEILPGTPKKAPRKSLPSARNKPRPSTPQNASFQADEQLPEITKDVLCLRDDGVVFTDPPLLRGVPLEKITPEHPYWDKDWEPIEKLVEPIMKRHQERYEQLEKSGSTHRDKHLAHRDAKRGRTILRFLEEGELHPYQLVGKDYITPKFTHYDTLFRLAQLLLEELPKMGLDVKPSEWLRQRLHEVLTERGDKFNLATWLEKAYHDHKLEQLRDRNGFPRVGRPPAHVTQKRLAESGSGISSTKKSAPRPPKRKEPHATPETAAVSTPSKAKAVAAGKASPAAEKAKPKKIKIVTNGQSQSGSETSPAYKKPRIILNTPVPPSAMDEKAPQQHRRTSSLASALEYDGYTSSDSISEDPLTKDDWRLYQVKTRTFASNPGVTQYWHWVRKGKIADRIVEHQVLESVRPTNWAVFMEPYNFHLNPPDIEEVLFARGSTRVVVKHKPGKDGVDLHPRGDVMAQFKRERTKRRFLRFLKEEKQVRLVEVGEAATLGPTPPHTYTTTSPTLTMLYETIGIVRPGNLNEVKEIVLAAGQLILRQGGVIRDISNWGVFHLPRAISRNQTRHTRGHYFVLRYDAGIRTHQDVTSTLRVDPRVIRAGGVKLGDGKLDTLSKFGEVKWRSME
ncbi:uncharacterized protein B0T15DRAFT_487988 [Chaetomium strumarium]|uniref:Small ribosomal subunit protein bS6m n=1 Tax=Chaetomium strumarium TaxID=1170767 RepID=A0AAJ0GKY9_9PEZI|nr:hypothetical protein B0T15DRAFT_487988 [Chaetomium strumarium]